MSDQTTKHVLLGVSGGIAAYKSPDLVRRLRERGHQIRVVMTRGATNFITPLSLQAVSGQPVHTTLLDEQAEAAMGHIELARWADVVLVAPATADIIARLAHGLADDLPEVSEGHILPPTGPGLGTRLKPEVFARPDATLRRTE